MTARLALDRAQILGFRRRVGALEERLAPGRRSLRTATWAGLQDSMPRAAVLALHARVTGIGPMAWADASLAQLWGPRYTAYVVYARDRAVFSLGRLPDDARGRERAQRMAAALKAELGERGEDYATVGRALGVKPNALRFAATTGTVLIRWDGARRPEVRSVDAPDVTPAAARSELARRHLHVFGPTTAAAFARWAGISPRAAATTYASLGRALIAVSSALGEGRILARDEPALREPAPAQATRLLPAGDPYFLAQGAERGLLVPDPARRDELWTPRVWPGAILVRGEIRGIWRRADEVVTARAWGRLARSDREAVAAEAAALPIPGCAGRIRVRWTSDQPPAR